MLKTFNKPVPIQHTLFIVYCSPDTQAVQVYYLFVCVQYIGIPMCKIFYDAFVCNIFFFLLKNIKYWICFYSLN